MSQALPYKCSLGFAEKVEKNTQLLQVNFSPIWKNKQCSKKGRQKLDGTQNFLCRTATSVEVIKRMRELSSLSQEGHLGSTEM